MEPLPEGRTWVYLTTHHVMPDKPILFAPLVGDGADPEDIREVPLDGEKPSGASEAAAKACVEGAAEAAAEAGAGAATDASMDAAAEAAVEARACGITTFHHLPAISAAGRSSGVPTEGVQREGVFAEGVQTEGVANRGTNSKVMQHYFCRRCMVYDCELHGCDQPLPRWSYSNETKCLAEHPFLGNPFLGKAPEGADPVEASGREAFESTDALRALMEDFVEEPVSKVRPQCECGLAHRLDNFLETEGCLGGALLARARHLLKNQPAAAQRCVSEPGSELHASVGGPAEDLLAGSMQQHPVLPEPDDAAAPPDDGLFSNPFRIKYGKRGLRAKELRLRLKKGMYRAHQTQACNCEGPCDTSNPNCVCIASLNFCEAFCSCGPACKNRWPGCRCKKNCRTQACPCWAAGRECDPDICHCIAPGCCDSSRLNCTECMLPKSEASADRAEVPAADPANACQNNSILLRNQLPLLTGPSGVAGWGAFAGEDTEKSTFIIEYLGERISQEEAERRGQERAAINAQPCSTTAACSCSTPH